jgi:hypothetical protein
VTLVSTSDAQNFLDLVSNTNTHAARTRSAEASERAQTTKLARRTLRFLPNLVTGKPKLPLMSIREACGESMMVVEPAQTIQL